MTNTKVSQLLEKRIVDETSSILIVDDDPFVISALQLILEREGYEVFTENNGISAIETIRKKMPAIIICDQIMPGMTGIEVLKKTQEILPDSVRILLTAAVDSKTAIDAINVGHVNQYITKPWRNADLIKAVRGSLEKYKLVKENRLLQDLIFYQHQELQTTHESLKEELELGASIHKNLLLGKIPEDTPGLHIEAVSYPSKEIDGDFFEFYRPTKRYLDLVLGDVMGKGIAAALVGTAVKTQLIRFAVPFPYQQYYDQQNGWHTNILPPDEILVQVHQEICQQLIDLEYFVSLFYGRFDLEYKTLTYVDCGSAKPIHFMAKEKHIKGLEGSDFPLGMVAENSYHPLRVSYRTGDVFVFYSDGVTEARSPQHSLFGYERLCNLIREHAEENAGTIVHKIKEAVYNFCRTDKLLDDLTIVVIKIDQSPVVHFTKSKTAEFQSDLAQLSDVRKFIKRLLNQAPGDYERLVSEVQLMVNEAFCNIVKHGTSDQARSSIVIEAELDDQGIAIIIKDSGNPFDPMVVNEPSFCGSQDSGYGWQIIRELADKVSYTPAGKLRKNNQLSIYKRYYIGDDGMEIKHKKLNGILVITPECESLDAKDASRFKEQVIGLINENATSSVVCDLSQLHFIDSSGLGSLLSVLRELNTRGGDLKLSGMNQSIRTMFELVKMHKIFEIYHTSDDAVGSF